MKLFRGVNKGNKTMPEKYLTDGLLTKQAGSGDDPEPHKKYGPLNTVLHHIQADNDQQKFVYNTTQYLSFSSEKSICLGFLAGEKHLPFAPCSKEEATAYLFTITIDDKDLVKIGNGLYRYSYSCNYNRHTVDPSFYSLSATFCKCNICTQNPGYLHQLLLIDVVTLLAPLKTDYPVHYANAFRDKEWLLMPQDPMMDFTGIGYQSNVVIADFWDVEFYKYI